MAQGPSTAPTRAAPTGSRPVAEAISRWKAARAAADKAEGAAEEVVSQTAPETAPEPVPETVPETMLVPETMPVPEMTPESVPEPMSETANEPATTPDLPSEALAARSAVIPHAAVEDKIPGSPVPVARPKRFVAPLLLLGVVAVWSRSLGDANRLDGRRASAPTSTTPPRVEPKPESPPEPPPPVVAKPRSPPQIGSPVPATTNAESEPDRRSSA